MRTIHSEIIFLFPVYTCASVKDKMPKKKTGQRKKAEKQRERQREIRTQEKSLVERPCNYIMVQSLQIYMNKARFHKERGRVVISNLAYL